VFFRARFDALFFALFFVGLFLTEIAPNLGLSGERTYWAGAFQDLNQMLQSEERHPSSASRGPQRHPG